MAFEPRDSRFSQLSCCRHYAFGIGAFEALIMHLVLCSRGTLTLVDRVSSCEDWIILTGLFCLSVVAPPRHESPEYFRGADVVVPQTISVCECSFSSPMRLRVSRG